VSAPNAGSEQPLRILHVLTYVSATNVFGGPTSVAVGLSKECERRGHEAVILAPADDATSQRSTWQDVPAQFFKAHRVAPLGFSGIAAPAGLRWYNEHADDFDVVHVHMARDLFTLPVAALALRKDKPLILQTHGMVDPSARLLAKPLDRALTRRVLRTADSVLYLTDYELRGLEAAAGTPLGNTSRLRNGIRAAAAPVDPAASNELLFMSRFEDRKRPDHFVRMAHRLIEEGHDLRFALVGPDQGMLTEVLELIDGLGISDRVAYEGALPPEKTLERVSRARALVLPSVREPFPMVLLESMSVGVPVICTTGCGLAEDVRSTGAGLVCEPDLDSLVNAARSIALDDATASTLGQAAFEAAQGPLGIEQVGDDLLQVYRRALALR